MLLYIFVTVFPLIVGYTYVKKMEDVAVVEAPSHKYNWGRFWWLMVAAFPMFFLIAFRSGYMGADAGMYQNYFKEMVDTPWSEVIDLYDYEKGFLIFEKLLTYVTSNALVYQCIYTLIYMITVVDFANRLEEAQFTYLFLFATIGLYTFMFTAVRQCLAICICLFSYRFVKDRKIFKFALCILLAFFFQSV